MDRKGGNSIHQVIGKRKGDPLERQDSIGRDRGADLDRDFFKILNQVAESSGLELEFSRDESVSPVPYRELAQHQQLENLMALTQWNKTAWDQIVESYPKLAGKSEGIAFCAALLEDNPGLKLNDVRHMGQTFAPELTFSPISISSAEVAMGRREPTQRKPRRARVAPEGHAGPDQNAGDLIPAVRSARLSKIERKLGIALSVIEQYEIAKKELDRTREALRNLNPTVIHLMAELDESARAVLVEEGMLEAEVE